MPLFDLSYVRWRVRFFCRHVDSSPKLVFLCIAVVFMAAAWSTLHLLDSYAAVATTDKDTARIAHADTAAALFEYNSKPLTTTLATTTTTSTSTSIKIVSTAVNEEEEDDDEDEKRLLQSEPSLPHDDDDDDEKVLAEEEEQKAAAAAAVRHNREILPALTEKRDEDDEDENDDDDEAAAKAATSAAAPLPPIGPAVPRVRWQPYDAPAGALRVLPYGGVPMRDLLWRRGFVEETDGDEWNLLFTTAHQNVALRRRRGAAALPLAPPRNRLHRVHNHCVFFLPAGQKCALATAVNRFRVAFGGAAARGLGEAYYWQLNASRAHVHALMHTQDPPPRWVAKPCVGSQGAGLRFLLSGDARRLPPASFQGVVQRYVEPPLLLDARKFHVRLFLLVTSYTPFRMLLYNDGLVALAARDFAEADDVAQRSNTAIGARRNSSSDGGDGEHVDSGRTMLLRQLWRALEARFSAARVHAARVALRSLLTRFMCTYEALRRPTTSAATLSGRRGLEAAGTAARCDAQGFGCVDLFGVDVMFDAALAPHVLEINQSPDLSADGDDAAYVRLKRALARDTLGLLETYVRRPRAATPTFWRRYQAFVKRHCPRAAFCALFSNKSRASLMIEHMWHLDYEARHLRAAPSTRALYFNAPPPPPPDAGIRNNFQLIYPHTAQEDAEVVGACTQLLDSRDELPWAE